MLSTQCQLPSANPGLGRVIDFIPGEREIGRQLEVGVLHAEEIERVLTVCQERIIYIVHRRLNGLWRRMMMTGDTRGQGRGRLRHQRVEPVRIVHVHWHFTDFHQFLGRFHFHTYVALKLTEIHRIQCLEIESQFLKEKRL